MTRPMCHRGKAAPRWVRGLLVGVVMAAISTGSTGCGLIYVMRNISPLHPTGWSFPYPIFAYTQQRLEDDIAKEEYDRVPVLDPTPENYTAPPCLDPPSEEEVWKRVPHVRAGFPPFYEVHQNNVKILIEKIGEKVDPCKVFPLVGPAQKISCHYKCTVYYDESYWADYPVPYNHVDHKVEVIYIDKDYLRRCGGPPVATTPPIENSLNAPPQPY